MKWFVNFFLHLPFSGNTFMIDSEYPILYISQYYHFVLYSRCIKFINKIIFLDFLYIQNPCFAYIVNYKYALRFGFYRTKDGIF